MGGDPVGRVEGGDPGGAGKLLDRVGRVAVGGGRYRTDFGACVQSVVEVPGRKGAGGDVRRVDGVDVVADADAVGGVVRAVVMAFALVGTGGARGTGGVVGGDFVVGGESGVVGGVGGEYRAVCVEVSGGIEIIGIMGAIERVTRGHLP